MAAGRIEISGGIGAGKTTLARALAAARPGARLVEEEVRTVPFFDKFYAAPQTYGLEKNLSFVLSHADRIRTAGDDAPLVCDYAGFQDLAYSDIVCAGADLAAIEAVQARMAARIGHPKLLVHLNCAPATQLGRIAQRGRPQETGVGVDYLTDLCAAIDRRRAELAAAHPALRQVELDTDRLDLAADADALGAAARDVWQAFDDH
jgi:deoxyadenosine/deoxycytidine kinase